MRKAILSLLVIAICGCANGPTVSVPRVPAWVNVSGRAVNAIEVWAEVGELAPGADAITTDSQFTAVDARWFRDTVKWLWAFRMANGTTYVSESFDCDKFAKALTIAAEVSAARAGVRAQPLVARVHVVQAKAWGGIDAGGGHAIVAAYTTEGLLVAEPQTGFVGRWADYPNKGNVIRVMIGG